jgi:hypothetical protein
MNHWPCVAARRPRAGFALMPRKARSGTRQARHPAQEPLRFWPRQQRSASPGLSGRVFLGIRRVYKFHRQGVPDSVRGSSNHALKRTAAGSGVPLSLGLAAA